MGSDVTRGGSRSQGGETGHQGNNTAVALPFSLSESRSQFHCLFPSLCWSPLLPYFSAARITLRFKLFYPWHSWRTIMLPKLYSKYKMPKQKNREKASAVFMIFSIIWCRLVDADSEVRNESRSETGLTSQLCLKSEKNLFHSNTFAITQISLLKYLTQPHLNDWIGWLSVTPRTPSD